LRIEDIYRQLFGFGSNTTYYSWKKDEKRKIIKLIEKYFTKEDLVEFLETGEIKSIEDTDMCKKLFKEENESYFFYVNSKMGIIINLHDNILEYYFRYLYFIKNNSSKFSIFKKPFHDAAISFSLQYDKKLSEKDIDSFHIFYDLIDFMDAKDGMWFYITHLVKNDLEYFTHGLDIDKYIVNGKINSDLSFLRNNNLKSPLQIEGLDHYLLYHAYNKINQYTIDDIN